jgi:hypothetical protein
VKYTPEKIFKLYEGWKDYMDSSWERGKQNLSFVEASQQEAQQETQSNSKEQFVFNISHKILKTAQANGKDIDLSLMLAAPSSDDKEEQQTFKLLIDQIMLNGKSLAALSACLDKVYAFGQGVFQIKNVRENEKTLNQVLQIENVEDVTQTFFDFKSLSPTFHDGNFCGRVYKMSRKKLVSIYKNLNKYKLNDECEVVDFWFKERKQANFVALTSGQYKREDLVDEMRETILEEPPRKGWVTSISYVRAIKGYPNLLEKKTRLPFDMLPMVFNYGGSVWTGSQYETFPLGWNLRDTQILLNYSGSLLGDIMKSTQADKWLFNPEHVQSKEAKESANEINAREGGLVFTGNLQTIRREPSQQLPPALGQLFTELQSMMQNIAGSYFDENSSKIKAMSGVALDKMFNRADLVQNPVIVAHLNTINVLGCILQSMIPVYYRENRTLSVKDEGGKLKKIEINAPEPQPGGAVIIKNNVKDLHNKYEYQVKAAPSMRLQKQNTQVELGALYKMYPPAIAQTVDIYANSLDIPNASTISRRLSANIPEALVGYGNGEITLQQLQQEVSQKQAQAQQQQAQAAATSPQGQYLTAKTQGEEARAQTAQFAAHTARIKEIETAKNAHIKSVSGAVKDEMDNHNARAQRELEYVKASLQHLNDVIEARAAAKGRAE